MNVSNNNGFGLARERENRAMDVLSDVVLGLQPLDPDQLVEDARQLGYMASLAKGIVYDKSKRLLALEKMCRGMVSSSVAKAESVCKPVDAVQGAWGAAWHMDASKLRRELPLHVMKKRRLVEPGSMMLAV
jgi:hypothetical protein